MKTIKDKLTVKEFLNYVKEFFGLPMFKNTNLELTFKEWCQSLKDTEIILNRIKNK